MKSFVIAAVAGTMIVGCAGSPTSMSDRQAAGDGYYYYVNYILAVTVGLGGYGWVWYNYGPRDHSTVDGRLGDVDFASVGGERQSAAVYAEDLDKTVVHIDAPNGTDFTLVFTGDEAGTFSDEADVLIVMDGLRYSSELDGGGISVTLSEYPLVNGRYSGSVSGTVMSESGESFSLDATFGADRVL
jgi:hypothetical protein